jgi:hypothetical protein
MERFGMMRRLAMAATGLLAAAALALAATSKPEQDKPKADKIFNGKDLNDWQTKKGKDLGYWVVGSAKLDPNDPKKFVVSKEGQEMVNAKGGGMDIYSKYLHGDAIIKVEVMVPKGSNSGVYVMGEYEIQVLDSYGRDKNPGPGDMGAIYSAQPPKNPTYKKPGEWQSFEIHFIAPKFDQDGKKTANAKFVKVLLNGGVIHENVEMKAQTPGGVDGKEKAKGPLMFQGNHGPVSYRNVTIGPLKQ